MCSSPGSQHPPGSAPRWLAAPGPTPLPTRRAMCPASVSLSSKEAHRTQGVNRGTAQTYTVSGGGARPPRSDPGPTEPRDSALPAQWPPPPPAGAPWGPPARMRPAGSSSFAAVGGSARPRTALGSERPEGQEVGRGLASRPVASSSPAGRRLPFQLLPLTRARTRLGRGRWAHSLSPDSESLLFTRGSFLEDNERGSAVGEPVSREGEAFRVGLPGRLPDACLGK